NSRDPFWTWLLILLSAAGTLSVLAGAAAGLWRWRFQGRYKTGETPPHESCTIHLLHGKTDAVMPYRHAIEGALRLKEFGVDFTADVLPFIGHELHPDLVELAVEKLEKHIPARLWLQPGEGDDVGEDPAGRGNGP
ncbi:hypothetical protein P3G55_24455, partial [Leptospira sp. 96542]|nr:hypothetical protein [Leptospira sp. 96542]